MKKVLSAGLVLLLLSFAGSANAWHLEYTYTGNMGFDGGSRYFDLDDDYNGWDEAGWQVMDAHDDGSGGVIVEYDVYDPEPDGFWSNGHVSFQIVSDYGNSNTVDVDVFVDGGTAVAASIAPMGHYYGVEGTAFADTNLSTNFGVGMSASYVGSDVIDETITLQANTDYYVDAEVYVEAWAWVYGLPPDTFASWAEYDAFFDGEFYRHVEAFADGGLDFSLDIMSMETPVPLPGAVWLLGSGLIGLLGLRRKFRK